MYQNLSEWLHKAEESRHDRNSSPSGRGLSGCQQAIYSDSPKSRVACCVQLDPPRFRRHQMESTGQKWWLITGGSSGLGLAMALAVLQAGDKVIATGRNIVSAARDHPEFEELGGQWLQLDVTAGNAQQIVADGIRNAGGKIDVVVNNAGTLFLTSIEDARYDGSWFYAWPASASSRAYYLAGWRTWSPC